MKIIFLGANGQLGMSLSDVYQYSKHECFFYTKKNINICNKDLLEKKVMQVKPDFIVNSAAYTLVDKAESEKDKASAINEIAVKGLAELCRKHNIHLIHISTDYVFDGTKKEYYFENDKTNPQSVYGISKYNGEKAIRESECSYTILRTSWVFSEHGSNFLKTMLKLSHKNEISIVGDQVGCPTYARDIATAVKKIIDHNNKKDINGIFHFAGDTSASWYSLAKYIFQEAANLHLILDMPILKKIKTQDYFTQAIRPLNSRLDSSSIYKLIKIKPSNWKMGVKIALKAIKLKEVKISNIHK